MVIRRTAPCERFLFFVSSLTVRPLPSPTTTTESNQPFSTCCWPSALRPTWGWCIWPSRWVTVMQWAAAPWRHAWRYINASQNTSEFLSTRLPSRCHSGCRRWWSRRVTHRSESAGVLEQQLPAFCVQRDGNCSLTLQTFLSRQQVALRKKSLGCRSWFTSGPLSVTAAVALG